MSERDAAMEEVRSDHNLWGRHKWRGKFFFNDDREGKYLRQKGNLDDDVADFLNTSDNSARAGQKPVGPQPHVENSGSARWPPASQVSKFGAGAPLYPRRKTPGNKNLHVTFESAAPEIIGEGGDEAQIPSIEVSRSRKPPRPRPHSYDQSAERATKSVQPFPPEDQFSGTLIHAKAHEMQAPELVSLRRKPTIVENASNNDALQIRDSSNQHNAPNLQGPSSADISQESQTNAQDVATYQFKSKDRMPAADRKAFHVEVEAPPPQLGGTRSYGVADTKGREAVSSLNLLSLESALPVGNSLTPTPSPQPVQRIMPSAYPFPSSGQGETVMPYTGSTTSQHQHRPPDKLSPKTGSEARPFLRSIAKSFGDDALEDFGARVQRFNEVFRLGITAPSLPNSISFPQWTRTSAWWFLKGRQELEDAVRGRPRSADGPSADGPRTGGDEILYSELKQAYLNLAKAWWITKTIVPGHSELRKYGDASMSSSAAIVESFGNAELAEAVEVHLGIVTNMRALTMSMKRNSKLPPDDFEIQGLVSQVWIQYPKLSATFRSLLSARNPKSLVNSNSYDAEPFLPITVGDTKRYFNYGTMFVVLTRNDEQTHIQLPCVVTILRERSSWDLDFTMISQDGQVSIMVQNNKQAGLTWQDVRWKSKMYIMQITLTDGFEIDVQFSEKDFKSLWGIRDHIQKISKGLQCGKTEKFVFETNVRRFQFFDSKGSPTFPAEPIKDCKIRLFEKTVIFVEGTGQRRVHDGHRLTIVTSPTVKTLSSITNDLGKQTPILFSYLRGEDGAPAILLKSPRSCSDSSMVMTFQEPSERRRFHALLDGTSIANDEQCTTCMPLKSLSISGEPTSDASLLSNGSFIADFQWHQLRVLAKNQKDEDHGGPPMLRSENLRVWADCDMGTFVDRINLGMSIYRRT